MTETSLKHIDELPENVEIASGIAEAAETIMSHRHNRDANVGKKANEK